MTLRQIRRAVQAGEWVLAQGPILAHTEFQRKRLTEAVSAARIYLEGTVLIGEMARTMGVTDERAAQIVRLGISYLRESGSLRPRRTGERPTATRP